MSFIVLPNTHKVGLVEVPGEIEGYKDQNLPEYLKNPYKRTIYDSKSVLWGYASGSRSTIMPRFPLAVKFKGNNFLDAKTHDSGEPFGGMSEKKCLRELDCNYLQAEYLRDNYDSVAPLESLGRFIYADEHNDSNVNCAILNCRGDIRLSDFLFEFYSMHEKQTTIFSDESLHDLLGSVCEWTAFAYRILKETGINPGARTQNPDNYVFYILDTGDYALGNIDHGSSKINQKKINIKNICTLPKSIALGMDLNPFLSEQKLSPFIDWLINGRLKIHAIDSGNENMVESTLFVKKDRLKFTETCEKAYKRIIDDYELPTPIDSRLMEPFIFYLSTQQLKSPTYLTDIASLSRGQIEKYTSTSQI